MNDPQDFEQLVLRYQGVVCAVAFSVLRDRARSEEVAQEAFLIAWQKLPSMSPPPAMPGWLCGISKNLAANAARRRKETAMAEEPVSTATPLGALLDHEADVLARHALAQLADKDREVVVLYYRGEGSIADVAATLGITEPAARQRLHRGRERLKSALTAVETTLRTTRPGPAFTAACVAALGTRAITAEAAKAATTTSSEALPIAAIAISAALAVIFCGAWAIESATSSSSAAPGSSAGAVAAATTRAASAMITRITETERTVILDEIHSARTNRSRASTAPVVASSSTGAPSLAGTEDFDIVTIAPGEPVKVYDFAGGALDDVRPLAPLKPGPLTLSKATLRHAIQSIQPLLLQCYNAASNRLARKDGTITVVVRLTGEPDVGTLVESARLDGDAHLLADAELVECMQETLMSIELPPMEEGGSWDVNYPFTVGRH